MATHGDLAGVGFSSRGSQARTASREARSGERARSRPALDAPRELLRALARMELTIAQLQGAGLGVAPTLDEKMVLGEEALRHLRQFESLCLAYGEAHGRGLSKDAGRLAAELPRAATWIELSTAEWLLLAGARVAATACVAAYERMSVTVPSALEEVAAHLREQFALADGMLRELLHGRAVHATLESEAMAWLPVVAKLFTTSLCPAAGLEAKKSFLALVTSSFPSAEARGRLSERI